MAQILQLNANRRVHFQVYSAQTSLLVYSSAPSQPHSRDQLDDDDIYTPRVYFVVRITGPTTIARCRPLRFVLADFIAYREDPESEIGRLDYLTRTDLLFLTAGDLH